MPGYRTVEVHFTDGTFEVIRADGSVLVHDGVLSIADVDGIRDKLRRIPLTSVKFFDTDR